MTIAWTILVLLLMYFWYVAVFTFNIFGVIAVDPPLVVQKFGVLAIGFVIGLIGVGVVYALGVSYAKD